MNQTFKAQKEEVNHERVNVSFETVELALYNLKGQKVIDLVEGALDAETYTVRWDGLNAQGQELASGIYLYRLTAGTREETRRLLLLR